MQEVKGDVALVLTVVLDQGQEVIQVREHDDPSALAEEFCRLHRLDASIVPTMTSFIEKHIADNEAPHKTPGEYKAFPCRLAEARLHKKTATRKSVLRQRSEGQLNTSVKEVRQPFKCSINSSSRAQTPKGGKPRSLASSKCSTASNSYQRLYEEAKSRKVKAEQLAEEL